MRFSTPFTTSSNTVPSSDSSSNDLTTCNHNLAQCLALQHFCQSCYKSHLHCDMESPCANCKMRDRTCSYPSKKRKEEGKEERGSERRHARAIDQDFHQRESMRATFHAPSASSNPSAPLPSPRTLQSSLLFQPLLTPSEQANCHESWQRQNTTAEEAQNISELVDALVKYNSQNATSFSLQQNETSTYSNAIRTAALTAASSSVNSMPTHTHTGFEMRLAQLRDSLSTTNILTGFEPSADFSSMSPITRQSSAPSTASHQSRLGSISSISSSSQSSTISSSSSNTSAYYPSSYLRQLEAHDAPARPPPSVLSNSSALRDPWVDPTTWLQQTTTSSSVPLSQPSQPSVLAGPERPVHVSAFNELMNNMGSLSPSMLALLNGAIRSEMTAMAITNPPVTSSPQKYDCEEDDAHRQSYDFSSMEAQASVPNPLDVRQSSTIRWLGSGSSSTFNETEARKQGSLASPVKHCKSCGTIDTPEWRIGKTMCNACGLRFSRKAARMG